MATNIRERLRAKRASFTLRRWRKSTGRKHSRETWCIYKIKKGGPPGKERLGKPIIRCAQARCSFPAALVRR